MIISDNFDTIQVVNTPIAAGKNIAAFAYTNAFLSLVSELNQPILHFWTTHPCLILGLKDKRLPHLADGIASVKNDGYDNFLRNSGGLAVVSDGGILNVSIFLPQESKRVSVDDAYTMMEELISQAFPELTIDHLEIAHSYCPGDFDLSVNGQKIAGISQRRTPQSLTIMLYLSVTGNQQFRGEMVKRFYKNGLGGEPNTLGFPDVWPETMTTLEVLLKKPLTTEDIQKKITDTLTNFGMRTSSAKLNSFMNEPTFKQQFDKEFERMAKRQPKLN
ncbi:lipoate--protein ligase family protein [Secundilactobacillus malefermentans]|uniref:lipoate--protein ligase family protein n=1 Tax=Secundilactobacillus malefermentans TaxID=176292 RepID=UPI0011CBD737|nr:lipoate--protein ligase family protein [Secundilactobacillus malefermentans]QEA31929.1 lipoate--protein ligase family protein [Secundilactobacillus malefermentans]